MYVFTLQNDVFTLQNDAVKKASGPGGGAVMWKGDEKVELQD